MRQGWLDEDAAAGMLAWPHSGSAAYVGPGIEEREGVLRVARHGARAPVADSRLRYDAERAEVELVSDRNDGPYAGAHRFSALEFIARWLDHVPERYEVRVRYSGACAASMVRISSEVMRPATTAPAWITCLRSGRAATRGLRERGSSATARR